MSNLGLNSEPEGPALASLTNKPGLVDNQPVFIQPGEVHCRTGMNA